MNFLAVGLCIEISTGLLYYYMKLHNELQRMVVKDFVKKTKQNKTKNRNKTKQTNKQTNKTKQKKGLDNTAKAVDHVKIESI